MTGSVLRLLRAAFQPSVAGNALRVSLVVGTVLNFINERDALRDGGPVAWGNVALNFLVPYCVASYSAARIELRRHPPDDEGAP